jgi:hypothetical protein
MTINYGKRDPGGLTAALPGDTLYIPYATYNDSGASINDTGIDIADVVVFKNGGVTKRATDSGIHIGDTGAAGDTGQYGDNIGLNRISLRIYNTSDDTGFYDEGSQYHVAIVNGLSIDAREVNFFPAVFELGTPRANIVEVLGDSGAAHLDQGRFGVVSDTGKQAAVLDTGKVASAVWTSHATRALTAFAHDTGVADTVWKSSHSTYTDTGSLGYGVNVSYLRTDTGAAAALATNFADTGNLVDNIWDEVLTGATHNVSTSSGRRLRNISGITTIDSAVNDTGVGTPNATTTVFRTDLTEVNDFWNDAIIIFTSGALSGQARTISDFANANGEITLDEALTSAPADNVEFVIHSTHVHTKSSIAGAVWDEEDTGHQVAGTMGFRQNDTGEIANAVWAKDARSLTAFAFDTGVANTVWKESSSTYIGDTGSVGYAQGRLMAVKGDTGAAHLDAGRLGVTATSSLDTGATKDAVWGTAPGTSDRYLTGSANVDTGVSDTVWKQASRTLTAFAHDTGVANTVWKESSSTYTGDTGSVGYAQGRLMAVKGDTGAAHLDQGRLGVVSDSGKQAAVLDTGKVAAAVWTSHAARTVLDTGIAQAVWKESLSTYTDTGSFGYGVNIQQVNQTLITGTGDTGLADTWRPA